MSSPSLRIGFVCYPGFGGSGIVAAELAQGMARRGHHVHLLATAPPARRSNNGAPVFFNQVSVADYPLFDHAPYALAMAAKIVEVVNEHPLDILHVHYAVPHSASALLAAQVLAHRRPHIITTLHGTDVTRIGVDPSLQTINRFAVEASDSITVPSLYLQRAAYQDLGISPELAIEIIPNFVDTDHFTPAQPKQRQRLRRLFDDDDERDADAPVLVHVSNFRPVKRVIDVVEIAGRIAQRVPLRLLMVGDGPERSKAAQRVRELGLTHRVSFLGAVSSFAHYLKHADLFILTSETESFGLAALEALSAGVPVVAYEVGGLSEVVTSGEVGLLTPCGDLDATAEAIAALLADPERRGRMAQKAVQHALRHFSREPALDRYESYYQKVLQEGPKGGGEH